VLDDGTKIPGVGYESQLEHRTVRLGMGAVVGGASDHIERGALGLAKRRVAAMMTSFAQAAGDGRSNHPYKETEIAMSSVSPLAQRRERRTHQPELSWAELRRLQEEYERDVLAAAARKAGMPEPSDELMQQHAAIAAAYAPGGDFELAVKAVDYEVPVEGESPPRAEDGDTFKVPKTGSMPSPPSGVSAKDFRDL
jgi:hypothetical protein